ncbi:MAG: TonB-dependent receptor [Thermodesulfobacteriota bacterium]
MLIERRRRNRLRLAVITSVMIFLGFPAVIPAEQPGESQPAKASPTETPRFELETIVVTGSRVAEEIRGLPKNVTVITSEEIEQATSNNVVDLLAREANVNLRSFYGHDKFGGVDIRGMGDTFVSNVLVLIDGVRLNTPDMAGPDLSSIPLDQIERIEILRGSGSVLYGDGAVGGVINIITKKGGSAPTFKARTSIGSYDTTDTRISYGGRIKKLDFNLSGSYFDSAGYRDNGRLRKTDAGVYTGYDFSQRLTAFFSAALHRDKYGLPGPVSKKDAENPERRKLTKQPHDRGETEDQRYRSGFNLNLDQYGQLSAQFGLRHRENNYILGYSPLLAEADQTSRIDEDSRSLNIGYLKKYRIGGLEHRLQLGFDYFFSDYQRTELSSNLRHNSQIDNHGLYVFNKWSLPLDLGLHAGFRRNEFHGLFRRDERKSFGVHQRWINGAPFTRDWTNDSFDLGLVYSPTPFLDLFADYATSFRTPNTDEFALAAADLRPQKGEHLEIGLRRAWAGWAEFSVTLFQIRIEDEIYYGEDPATGTQLNRNYDQRTIRRGVETEVKLYLTDKFFCWANLGIIDARFEGSGAYVPLVPEYKANIGAEWRIVQPLAVSVTGAFVGQRYDGNDWTNDRYDQLQPYSTFDAKLSYDYRNLRFFCGVNNIFDELYSVVGYSETYYPLPGRNFYAGVEFLF